ncbi:uncharacterized protein LOC127003625 [Eriocheir sinensis]|uniref:uncharacterized protein LOC127003625 n=1 Tax=Eriocheir sinensis TaxID=95602 RepID=UPI0021C8785B|nr:uncharacterized protein LOC127003625 [Eriocheir sinensis]
MRLLVILPTFLTVAVAAKLPTNTYSQPFAQHQQTVVDTPQSFAHTETSGLTNGQAGQNGLTQSYGEPNEQQAATQFNGQAGQNGLTQTYGKPVTQFNGQTGQNGLTQTYGEPVTQFNGQTGQNGLTQSYGEPVTQFNGQAGQNGLTQSYGEPVTQFNGQGGQNVLTQTYGESNGQQPVTQFNGQASQNGLTQSYNDPQGLIPPNGHFAPNGLTQTNFVLSGSQDLTQANGNAGINDLSLSNGAPAGSQNINHPNGHAGVFLPAHKEPVKFHPQTQQQGLTEQESSFETYEEPTESHGETQESNGQDLSPHTQDVVSGTQSLKEPNGDVCLEGQVRHADGSCVTPEVTRSVYVFGVTETPRPSARPSPRLPPPKVHEHVLLIRAPERWAAEQSLVVPPPAQKSVVYILRKELEDEDPRIIEAPVTPPPHPEVFFVNYKDGDNVSLPNGLNLQKALQGAITGPTTLLDAAEEGNAAEDAQVTNFPILGDKVSLEGQSEEDLVSYRNGAFTTDDLREGTFVLEGQSDDDDLYLESQTDGSIILLEQRDGDDLIDQSDEDSLAGHSNGSLVLKDNRNGGHAQGGHSGGFAVNGNNVIAAGFQSDEALFFRGHSDDGLVLSGHSDGGFVPNGDDSRHTDFNILRDESLEYQFSSVEDSLGEAPGTQEVIASSVFGGSPQQVRGDGGNSVPAQLLSVSFEGNVGSFSGLANSRKETAVRGSEETPGSASQAAAFGDASYGPPSRPAAGPAQLYAPQHSTMRLLVILPTLLTVAVAAKLPTYTYSRPFAQHQQTGVDTPQSFAHTGTSRLTNGQAGQNGLSQSYGEPVTQFNGQASQNSLTQSYGEPNGQQPVTQFNDQAGQNGLSQTYGEPVTQFNGQAGQNGLTHSYNEPQGLIQSSGYYGQNGLTQTSSRPAGPQDLTQTNGHSGKNDRTQTYAALNGRQDLIHPNGHFAQNGLTQTNLVLSASQDLTQANGNAGINDLSLSNGAPAGSQNINQPNGHAGVFLPAHEEPVRFHPQTQQQGLTEQDNSFETYENPTESHSQTQESNGQDLSPHTQDVLARPQSLKEPHGDVCLEGQVRHADGSCVTPEVTRSVYVFGVTETPRPSARPSPRLPPPKVHEHVLLIRAPKRWAADQSLVVPPPAQKSVVYILRKELEDEDPRIIEAPVTPPPHPEVFFVNYKDGDNVSLPNGLNLQQALQGAITSPTTLLDAAEEGAAAENAQVTNFPILGDKVSLEGQSEEDLVSYRNGAFTTDDLREGTFVLEGQSDDDLSLESQTDGSIILLEQRDGDDLIDQSDEDSLAGHSNAGLGLKDNRNGGHAQGGHSGGFAVNGNNVIAAGFQSDEALFFRGHSDDSLVLSGHSDGGFVPNGDDRRHTDFNILRDESLEYQFSSVEDSLGEAPGTQEVIASSVFGGSPQQVRGDGGNSVPAQLLSVSFEGNVGSFSGLANSRKETAVRGSEETPGSASQAAAFGDASYGPPSRPAAGPAQLYAPP